MAASNIEIYISRMNVKNGAKYIGNIIKCVYNFYEYIKRYIFLGKKFLEESNIKN